MEHGVGTTCISLALSNYICSKLGKRTAYIELNTTNQICCLSSKKETGNFSYMGITFFPAMRIASLPEILNMDFDYFILDMGVLNAYTAREFVKCEKQFLVCSLCEWKKHISLKKMEVFIKKNNINQEHVTVLGNMIIKGSKITISSEITCRFHTLPVVENPFQLSTTDFTVYNRLLN